MFKPVDNKPDFPKLEHAILDFWRETDAFRKLQEKNKGNELLFQFQFSIGAHGAHTF